MKQITETALKLCIDIHGLQKMNSTDFGDFLTFPLVPQGGYNFSTKRRYQTFGQNYNLELFLDQIHCPLKKNSRVAGAAA